MRRKGFFHLDQPGKEEDERDEVEIWAPAWEAVDGSIHDEDPSLLRRSLIYGEYTGACKRRRQEGHDGDAIRQRRGRSPCLRHFSAPRVVWLGTETQKFRHKHSLGIRCFLLPSYAFLSPNSWMRWLSLLLKYSLVPCCAGVLQYLCIKGTRLNEELHTQGQIAFMAMLYYVFLIIQVWKWTNPQGT